MKVDVFHLTVVGLDMGAGKVLHELSSSLSKTPWLPVIPFVR